MLVVTEFYVKLAGVVFLLLGAVWAGVGLWLSEFLITVSGGLAGAAGVVLLGLAPRLEAITE